MSLRYKILLALASVMILILGILTLNLWINALGRVQSNQQKMADVLTSIVQDWLKDVKSEQDLPLLKSRLSTSALFTNWAIVNSGLEPIRLPSGETLSYKAIPNPEIFKQDADLKKVFATKQPVFSSSGGTIVYAPLMMMDNKPIAIKMDIQRPEGMEFNPLESVKTILLVMSLGTLILILSMYVLLTKLVLRPLESLVEVSRQVSQGNYAVTLPTVKSNDDTFRIMIAEINEYHSNLEAKIEDATEKIKTTEEQLVIAQRLSATGTLAAGIAHEINNPLGGILNATLALKQGNLDSRKSKEYIDLIIDGLTRMQDTLKKILQFFPRRLTPQPLDIKLVMERAVQLVQHRFLQQNIAFVNHLPLTIPQVFGDSTELQQVFLNLLMNAVDAVAARTIPTPFVSGQDKQIEIYHEVNDKDTITVCVKDTGIGMSPDEIERAFDLFYTTKEPGKGTGLGLSVAHNIIQNHHGKLVMESAKGKGTVVRVTLPVLKAVMEKRMSR
ncbi:MAG: HAMP domain-containing protein [Planctomycetes bacterium]|nr:HAMP domain-containing protein [Planctomycetota bacterium]